MFILLVAGSHSAADDRVYPEPTAGQRQAVRPEQHIQANPG